MTSYAPGAAGPAGALTRIGVVRADSWAAPDRHRALQLGLAGLWLFDAMLQFQAFMFTKGFGRMLGATAAGNPAVIGRPISWTAQLIANHATAANGAFAAIQLLLGIGIAWRPTVRLALAGSVAWSVAVWWLGEGLGGMLSGTASPVNGAPGAVILYALAAVLLWPARQDKPAAFAAGRFTGPQAARGIWLGLWGSLAFLALRPATGAPAALPRMISRMAAGQPRWLGRIETDLAALLAHRGPAAAVLLAIMLAVVAVGIYLPQHAVRAVLVLAVLAAAGIWLVEGLGGILTGGGTDPNSGPLLALLALSYWPHAHSQRVAAGDTDHPAGQVWG
jgi:hypothetical protein